VEYQDTALWLRAWFIAFCLTVVVEMPIVTWLSRRAEPRLARRAIVVLAGNALSHPAVWFVFPALGLAWGVTTTISEVWAWLLEALLYRFALGKMTWRPALGVSLVANAASFGLGLALWAVGVLS
jgi:hypothetical protein